MLRIRHTLQHVVPSARSPVLCFGALYDDDDDDEQKESILFETMDSERIFVCAALDACMPACQPASQPARRERGLGLTRTE